MKNLLIILGVILLGVYTVNVVAWMKGNARKYSYIDQMPADRSEAKKPDPKREYYWNLTLEVNETPARFPGFWNRRCDTTFRELKSKKIH